MRLAQIVAVVTLLSPVLACGSDGGGGGGGASLIERSSACKAFADAECDFFSDKCKQADRAACDDLFGSIVCIDDDDRVNACVTALGEASCGSPSPAACSGIGDAEALAKACVQVADTLCDASISCAKGDATALSSCKQQFYGQVCTSAVGISRSVDTCLATAKSGCTNGKYALPPACKGVVKVGSSPGSPTPAALSGWEGLEPVVVRELALPSGLAERRLYTPSVPPPSFDGR